MKNQPFLFPAVGMVIGILTAQILPESHLRLLSLFLLVGVILFSLKTKFSFLGGSAILLFFIVFGLIRTHHYNFHNEINPNLLNEKKWIKVKVENTYRSSEKFRKYKTQVVSIDSFSLQRTHLLLYWRKHNPQLHPGDVVWINSEIRNTEPPKNPHQFNYKKYLSRLGIHYTTFAGDEFLIEENTSNWNKNVSEFKSETRQKLLSYGYSPNAVDIVGAMLLGDRTEIDEEVEEHYRKTGVVHILSISGLHIVMIYGIFYFLCYPLIYLPKGKFIRIAVCLVAIWLYAVFVDLQPPVARSALMISIFHLSVVLRRKPNIYHTLLLTFFLLLMVNPNFLFDVGFQLSYAAVFFIVWLMPVYKKILPLHSRTLIYIRDFLGTSISAQSGTFPFTAYYFHQTSGLFLAGNILMVPASFVMIVGGMFSILLVSFDIDLPFWTTAFNYFFHICNEYISWLSSYKSLIIENISMNLIQAILLIVITIVTRNLILKYSVGYLILILSLLSCFELIRFYKTYSIQNKEELIVFHQYKNSVTGIRKGKNLDLFVSDRKDSAKLEQYIVKPYSIKEGIESVNYFDFHSDLNSSYMKTENVLLWNGKRFIIVDENSNLDVSVFDFILIQNSSSINTKSLSQHTEIIIDGSNYPDHLKNHRNTWHTHAKGFRKITP